MNTNGESGSFELYEQKSDGEFVATGIHACSKCRRVAFDLEGARDCCEPRMCACGEPTGCRSLLMCAKCRSAEREQREAARWESATKVSLENIADENMPKGCNLFIYSERVDEFFCDAELLVERHEDDDLPIDRVYLCRDDHGNPPDATSVIEHCCDGMFEGAYEHISAEASGKLQRFLSEWWEANRPPGVVPSKVGVLIPTPSAVEGGAA